jgi:hypothetical protein
MMSSKLLQISRRILDDDEVFVCKRRWAKGTAAVFSDKFGERLNQGGWLTSGTLGEIFDGHVTAGRDAERRYFSTERTCKLKMLNKHIPSARTS